MNAQISPRSEPLAQVGSFLARGRRNQDTSQHDVLVHVGKISGMEGVLVIHRALGSSWIMLRRAPAA